MDANKISEIMDKYNNNKLTKMETILFEDGNSGNYVRTWDDSKTNERTIIIELEME